VKTRFLLLISRLCILFIFVLCGANAGAAEITADPGLLRYPPLKFEVPQTERVVLKNGLTVYIIQDRELPLVRAAALIRAGSAYDPPGKEGIAEIAATVMRTGGAASLSGDRIDERLDYSASVVSFTAGLDACTGSVNAHRDHFPEAFALFADMVRKPAFDVKKLAIAKNLKIESLRRIKDDPQKTAFREFRPLIYRDNPRGRLATIRSVGSIRREDLTRFHADRFRPGNMLVAITGDISREEALKLAERRFGDWKTKPAAAAYPDPPRPVSHGSVHLIEKTVPQSTIILGYVVPGKSSPDFYSLSVLDFLLGSGGFNSRLTGEIRNRRGLSYSTGSFYSAHGNYGAIQAYSITNTASTAEVLQVIRETLDSLRKKGVTEQELSWAKKSINNSFVFDLETAEQIAAEMLRVEFYGLPTDFLSSFRDRIEKVTSAEVRESAVRHLPSDGAVVLIVGNEDGFEKPVAPSGKLIRMKENF